MGFDESAPALDAQAQVDMTKVATKNFMKLSKKYLTHKAPQIAELFEKALDSLVKFM
jgi:hypothetical protein